MPERPPANPAAVVRTIVANLRSFWSVRAEPAPTGADGLVWWTSGGLRRPLNGVLALETADPGPATDRIAATFRLAGLPCAWIEGPDPSSPELGLRLLSLGYRPLEGTSGWALPIAALAQRVTSPGGVLVRHGRDPDLVRVFGELVGRGALRLDPSELPPLELLLAPRALPGAHREEVWVALEDGEPVAGVLTHAVGDSLGLFALTTEPSRRSAGFATSLALAAARGAATERTRWVVAEAPPSQAAPLRRLGFEEYCDFRRYGWEPQGARRTAGP